MSEEWRYSEAQVIRRGQWTTLNGTDVQIMIPAEASGGGAGGGQGGTVGGGGGGLGGSAFAVGAGSTAIGGAGGGGGGGVSPGALVVRVRRAPAAGE